jgi:hypothetical protein
MGIEFAGGDMNSFLAFPWLMYGNDPLWGAADSLRAGEAH